MKIDEGSLFRVKQYGVVERAIVQESEGLTYSPSTTTNQLGLLEM